MGRTSMIIEMSSHLGLSDAIMMVCDCDVGVLIIRHNIWLLFYKQYDDGYRKHGNFRGVEIFAIFVGYG